MDQLLANMKYLCDEARMLTGLSVSYGTCRESEHAVYGRAQEIRLEGGQFVPHVRMLKDDAMYDLASLTKVLTCACAMRLVELSKLSLHETVGDIDPRFAHLKGVTVFDTLCYRVCLQTPGRIDTAPDRKEGLRRLFAVAPAQPPAVRLYSDINAMVIKYVVEAKSGMAFFDALRAYVLEPAGMRETFCAVPHALRPRCVCYNYEHRIAGDRYILRTDVPQGSAHDPKALLLSDGGRDLCGHAGLFSTREDMVRFAKALLSGEILARETLLEIAENRTGAYNPDGTYRQPLGFLCFTRHPEQRLSEVPAYMSARCMGISGFTGNHIALDLDAGSFEVILGNRCHGRVSHIIPPEGKTLADYNLDERGAGTILWPDGRRIPVSARYVYQKDRCLHDPIGVRMQKLGWLD